MVFGRLLLIWGMFVVGVINASGSLTQRSCSFNALFQALSAELKEEFKRTHLGYADYVKASSESKFAQLQAFIEKKAPRFAASFKLASIPRTPYRKAAPSQVPSRQTKATRHAKASCGVAAPHIKCVNSPCLVTSERPPAPALLLPAATTESGACVVAETDTFEPLAPELEPQEELELVREAEGEKAQQYSGHLFPSLAEIQLSLAGCSTEEADVTESSAPTSQPPATLAKFVDCMLTPAEPFPAATIETGACAAAEIDSLALEVQEEVEPTSQRPATTTKPLAVEVPRLGLPRSSESGVEAALEEFHYGEGSFELLVAQAKKLTERGVASRMVSELEAKTTANSVLGGALLQRITHEELKLSARARIEALDVCADDFRDRAEAIIAEEEASFLVESQTGSDLNVSLGVETTDGFSALSMSSELEGSWTESSLDSGQASPSVDSCQSSTVSLDEVVTPVFQVPPVTFEPAGSHSLEVEPEKAQKVKAEELVDAQEEVRLAAKKAAVEEVKNNNDTNSFLHKPANLFAFASVTAGMLSLVVAIKLI